MGTKLANKTKLSTSSVTLTVWLQGTQKSMNFGVSMIGWRPQIHVDKCNFCFTKILGITSKSNHDIEYPNSEPNVCSSLRKKNYYEYCIRIQPHLLLLMRDVQWNLFYKK